MLSKRYRRWCGQNLGDFIRNGSIMLTSLKEVLLNYSTRFDASMAFLLSNLSNTFCYSLVLRKLLDAFEYVNMSG